MKNKHVRINGHDFQRHILLEITKKCNLKCIHCFTFAGSPLPDELEIDDWRIVARDLISNGFNAFTLSGGEPLLNLKKTISLAKYISSLNKKAKLYLFTNGILLTGQIVKKIKPYFDGICLSLDGVERTHNWLRRDKNNFESVLKGLDLLLAEKIPVFVQSMVTPQTIPYVENVVKICSEKGVKAIKFSHVDFYGRATLNKNIRCSASNLNQLSKKIKSLKRKYNLLITSNLVNRTDFLRNQSKFFIPGLHILSNGIVLPWYGFPFKYALLKYPAETFSSLKKEALNLKINLFYKVVEKSNKFIYNNSKLNIIDYDNVAVHFIDQD